MVVVVVVVVVVIVVLVVLQVLLLLSLPQMSSVFFHRIPRKFVQPHKNLSSEKGPSFQWKIVFQASFFRCYVSFRGVCNRERLDSNA